MHGLGVEHAIEVLSVRFPVVLALHNDSGNFVHTHVPVTKQYNLLLTNGGWWESNRYRTLQVV